MANVTITTSAVQIASKGRSSNKARIALEVYNNAAVTVWYGQTSAVTVANGVPLKAGEWKLFGFNGGSSKWMFRGELYGIVASGTADVRYEEYLETR